MISMSFILMVHPCRGLQQKYVAAETRKKAEPGFDCIGQLISLCDMYTIMLLFISSLLRQDLKFVYCDNFSDL